MEVLLVISKFLPEYTGAAHRLNKLYNLLPPDFSFSVLCGGAEYKSARIYTYDHLNIERLADHSSGVTNRWIRTVNFYRDFFVTLRALSRRKFDLLHIAGSSAQTCAALYHATRHNIPTVLELVTNGAHPLQPLPVLGKFLKMTLPPKTVLVAISEPLAQRCTSYGYKDICWSRPNPVDEDRFQPLSTEKKALRQKIFPFSDTDIVITMIAKFMPQKNQIFLLDVLAQLPENYKLALGGPVTHTGPLADRDNTYIAQLETRVATLGLKDRIFIQRGFIEEPQEWMQASDIYVLPNRDEGLGTPLLEAQACGLCVLANAEEASFYHWIDHEKTGFLVPMNPTAWAESLRRCMDISSIDLAARSAHIRSRYGLKEAAQTYQDIFTYLMGHSTARSLAEVLHGHA